MQYADKWQQEIEARFPKRHYKTSVIDVNGKNVFLTRFFRALKPPPEILEKATESAQSVSIMSHSKPSCNFCFLSISLYIPSPQHTWVFVPWLNTSLAYQSFSSLLFLFLSLMGFFIYVLFKPTLHLPRQEACVVHTNQLAVHAVPSFSRRLWSESIWLKSDVTVLEIPFVVPFGCITLLDLLNYGQTRKHYRVSFPLQWKWGVWKCIWDGWGDLVPSSDCKCKVGWATLITHAFCYWLRFQKGLGRVYVHKVQFVVHSFMAQ